jgi:hypothetical protein
MVVVAADCIVLITSYETLSDSTVMSRLVEFKQLDYPKGLTRKVPGAPNYIP